MNTTDIETRLVTLEAKVESLEKGRSGRRALPVIVSVDGICGVDPTQDSAICPHSSLYRRQKGCLGDACKAKASTYYSDYRNGKKSRKKVIKRKR